MVYPYGQTVTADVRGHSRSATASSLLHASPRSSRCYIATLPFALLRASEREHCAALVCQEYESPRFDVCVLLGPADETAGVWLLSGRQLPPQRRGRVRPPSLHAGFRGIIAGARHEARRVLGTSTSRPSAWSGSSTRWTPLSGGPSTERARERSSGSRRDAGVVAWHGRIAIHKKGLDLLVEAWTALRRSHRHGTSAFCSSERATRHQSSSVSSDAQRGDGVVWIRRFVTRSDGPSPLSVRGGRLRFPVALRRLPGRASRGPRLWPSARGHRRPGHARSSSGRRGFGRAARRHETT